MRKKKKYIEKEGDKYSSLEKIPGILICHLIKKEDRRSFYFQCEYPKYDKKEMYSEIKELYKSTGVWAMYGRKSENDEWECLQVAQKTNRNLERESIGCEIVADLEIMFLEIPEECNKCKDVIPEDRAFYEEVYERHKCEDCQQRTQGKELFYEKFQIKRSCKRKETRISLSRRFDIYHQIADKYEELAFFCVYRQEKIPINCDEAKEILRSNRKIECVYAQEHQAIYFNDIKFCSR